MEYKITETGGKVVIRTGKAMPSEVRQRMARAGFSCNKSGNTFIGISYRRELAEEILDDVGETGTGARGCTICADCEKAVGRCSWSGVGPDGKTLLFKPVEGWRAVKTHLNGTGKANPSFDSYRVISCPEFVRG